MTSKRPATNPKFEEGINYNEDHPLKEMLILVIGIGVAVVLLVVILSIVAEKLAPHVPFAWEEKAVGLTEGKFLTVSEPLPEEMTDPHKQAEGAIQELGQQLLTHSVIPEGQNYHFHLINIDVPNAFATLGGHVFVTTGLLKQVHSENALAMVIAHEIAHVKYRHPIQALGRGVVFQIVMTAIFGGESSAGSMMGSTGMLTLLSFNRNMEKESDDEALLTLQAMYGHTQGAEEFFEHMLTQADEHEWRTLFETHPGVESRINGILAFQQSNTILSSEALRPLDKRIVEYIALMEKAMEKRQLEEKQVE